jgi:hypothetical protein
MASYLDRKRIEIDSRKGAKAQRIHTQTCFYLSIASINHPFEIPCVFAPLREKFLGSETQPSPQFLPCGDG